jgi:hypothetical protein
MFRTCLPAARYKENNRIMLILLILSEKSRRRRLSSEINIIDCALQLISVKITFGERLFCLTESCVEVTVQVATKAPIPIFNCQLSIVCVFVAE